MPLRLLCSWVLFVFMLPTPVERRIAVTVDDLPTASVLGNDLERAQRTTRALVAALTRQRIPAIGFVNERKLAPRGVVEPARVALLEHWLDAGLALGNHTYSHVDLHRVDLETFKADVIKGDATIGRLLAARGQKPGFFRHPFLHTGTNPDTRRDLARFLESRGYRVAPVTIDNYDYLFAAAYDRASDRGDTAASKRIADEYLDYMDSVVAYYEQQSVAIVGRVIAQTLLLHASALNADTVDGLAERLRRRGYVFVPLETALQDAAYESKDEYIGSGGISWLHRWALTAGKRDIFAGEPAVPAWIQRAAEAR